MTNLDDFLVKVDKIQKSAKEEIGTKTSRMEVMVIHAEYLGPKGVLQKTLKTFSSGNDQEQSLSKHAIKEATDQIKTTCLNKVKQIVRSEQNV